MSYHSRVILPPGASRKRKERDAFYFSKPLNTVYNINSSTTSSKPMASNNKLLAGYLACEFLTRGTLLGQKFDPARAESKTICKPFTASLEAEPSSKVKPQSQSIYYWDVASLLKGDGAHIPGIVNPTQLDRWIQM